MALAVRCEVAFWKGWVPVNISKRISPKAKTSARALSRLPAQLLGRHVGGRAHQARPGGRDPRQGLGIGGGEALGHAEVHHLDVTIGGQHHVGGLQGRGG